MKCPKCEADFNIKDIAEDATENGKDDLYFECPKCDTPLEMTFSLKED